MQVVNRKWAAGFTLLAATLISVTASLADTWTPLPARHRDTPGFTYHPSPADWRDAAIYQIITDRFYDGDPSNNTANPNGVYNPLSMDGIHGGDFAGIRQKLDYIQYLGFNTIWISPVFLNLHGVYHGYHIIDFNRIDPHWGTLEELRALIDEAHARGMYVIIDVVFNHMARMTASGDPNFPRFSREPYNLEWLDENRKFPPPFDDINLFHAHGNIDDWESDEQNVLGELKGLADLKTEDARVRKYLTESHLALIAATDCDGFRIDTAHHVELSFWQEVLPAIKDGAAKLGKTNFLMFAEALRHKDDDVSFLTREGEFPSALYYPYYFTLKGVWAYREPTSHITGRWRHLDEYGDEAGKQLVIFADNHDRERLLNEAYLDGDKQRLKAVLTHLYASPGIPCFYYGTEQGFNGAKGHGAREPMFAAGRPDRFDASSEIARWTRELNAMRNAYPVLRKGETIVLHDENEAGVFAFARKDGDQVAVVVINNSEAEKTMRSEWFDQAGDHHVWMSVGPSERIFSEGLNDTITPDTAYVFVPSEQYKEKRKPSVWFADPAHGADGYSEYPDFTITFRPSLESNDDIALRINGDTVPSSALNWLTEGTTLTYTPSNPLPRNAWIEWSLAFSGDEGRYVSRFHTGPLKADESRPVTAFTADGRLDESVRITGVTNFLLTASYKPVPNMLYVATDPAGMTEDCFIMLAFSNYKETVSAPWNKAGTVRKYDVLISDEGESDYSSVRGTDLIHWSVSDKNGVFEAALQLPLFNGEPPQQIFLQVVTYGTEDKGERISGAQAPGESIAVDLPDLVAPKYR